MAIEIIPFILGPMANNSYLIGDSESREAVIIDPSFESEKILSQAKRGNFQITAIWLTHAHFDHFAGVSTIAGAFPRIMIGLHKEDKPLWEFGGGAAQFGFSMNLTYNPTHYFEHKEIITLGDFSIQVRHAPGHSRGHVIFYSSDLQAAFCGDVIFHRSIGRTDLPGGNYAQLIKSIENQIFTLPPATKLYCGHGALTTVEKEIKFNPFLK